MISVHSAALLVRIASVIAVLDDDLVISPRVGSSNACMLCVVHVAVTSSLCSMDLFPVVSEVSVKYGSQK